MRGPCWRKAPTMRCRINSLRWRRRSRSKTSCCWSTTPSRSRSRSRSRNRWRRTTLSNKCQQWSRHC
uniref:Uncharacterized protein n=1 Tax=Arundo donax TaxID=35708 RepID=A0A0A8XUD7_ARUDO